MTALRGTKVQSPPSPLGKLTQALFAAREQSKLYYGIGQRQLNEAEYLFAEATRYKQMARDAEEQAEQIQDAIDIYRKHGELVSIS